MPKINNIIDYTLIKEVVIGRVEPQIYAFSTETVPNYLKVGDTYRSLEIRLNEWRKYFPNLEKQFADAAKVDQETFFRDYAIHYFLDNDRQKQRLKENRFANLPYFSREFFENTNVQDVKDAIIDIKESYVANSGKYQFYKVDTRLPETHTYLRTENYTPRPNQQETIGNFKKALQNGRKNLLMYAVMRFGKSFTSMCCACEMDARVVTIVSAKADVKQEWKKTIESHINFADYEFIDSNALLTSDTVISEKIENNQKVAIFLTLQDLQGDEIKTKHKQLFGNQIDLLIIDETHFGARASEYGKVLQDEKLTKRQLQNELKQNDNTFEELETIKVLNAKIRLHLSGTPYRILMGDEFQEDDIIAFYQFSDIAGEQEKWNTENLNKDDIKEWDNPYYGFPQMVRFAFNPNESSRKKIDELREKGITYAFSALFRPKSITKDNKNQNHKIFEHEKEVLELLQVIDGTKEDENLLGFLNFDKIKDGNMCRHIVCVLPYRASCDAFENLIITNKTKFKNLNDYEIINISGVENERQYKDTQAVKSKIKKCELENKKSITLTVNRMLTGSTVEEWDTMLYFKDTASPQEYDQSIFRLQNKYIKIYVEPNGDIIKYNMKPQTLLVDFDPLRMFRMQEEKSKIYNVNIDKNGNTKLEERIKQELEISPIIVLNKNKIERVVAADILDAVRNYSRDKSVFDEATIIPIDFSLLKNENIRVEIEKQGKIGSKQGLEIVPTSGDGTDIDIPDIDIPNIEIDNIDNFIEENPIDIQPKPITDTEISDFKGRFAMYYAKILFFAFLTDSKVISLEDIVGQIDINDNNERIASSLDLNKNILTLLLNQINPHILSKLDYKIQNINDLAKDKTLQPIERASNAMKKFSRLSISEIVTPEKVTDAMVALFPEGAITKKTKILDIAAKQGEFVYAVYKKYGQSVAKNFYSIPTSKIAYEFTRKVYELLELPIENIVTDFNSYDIIKKENNVIIQKLKDMNFKAILGNPPYQESDGSGASSDAAVPIYNNFAEASIEIEPNYLSIIMPSKWMVGGRGLDSFRNKMITDTRIKTMFDFESDTDCFSGMHIDGGVCYFLWDKNYNGMIDYNYKESSGISYKTNRFLRNDFFQYIIRDNRRISIIEKVSEETRFSNIVYSTKPYGIRKDLFNYPDRYPESKLQSEPFKKSVKIYGVQGIKGGARRKKGYISKSIITNNIDTIDKYKLFFTTSYSTDATEPPEIIVGMPNEVCTETFLLIGPFENELYQKNCLSYMKTKFFKILLYFGKGTMQVTKSVFGLIPLQDFTQEWTDEKLYAKYGLTQDEINFIESMIRPM